MIFDPASVWPPELTDEEQASVVAALAQSEGAVAADTIVGTMCHEVVERRDWLHLLPRGWLNTAVMMVSAALLCLYSTVVAAKAIPLPPLFCSGASDFFNM